MYNVTGSHVHMLASDPFDPCCQVIHTLNVWCIVFSISLDPELFFIFVSSSWDSWEREAAYWEAEKMGTTCSKGPPYLGFEQRLAAVRTSKCQKKNWSGTGCMVYPKAHPKSYRAWRWEIYVCTEAAYLVTICSLFISCPLFLCSPKQLLLSQGSSDSSPWASIPE